jgi:formylglycine-generating enzyme required for sulfatase activity
MGSYVIVASAPGRATVRLPLFVERGETLPIHIALPPAESIPPGFVYIPEGRFLVGSADEPVRRDFLATVPLHQAKTGAFAIAKLETTYADWIAFLDELPVAEQEKRRPYAIASPGTGGVDLRKVDGVWRLVLQPTVRAYEAKVGESIVYLERAHRPRQDWRKLPVAAVSIEDANAYVEWLRRTNRVNGARLCSELEWERATRGADDREFPHGDSLRPDQANFDETYNKVPAAMGPDEVGSYPASASPFGLLDATGNIGEWTTVAIGPADGSAMLRGGSWYWGALTGRSTNRASVEPTFRSANIGVRVCADP